MLLKAVELLGNVFSIFSRVGLFQLVFCCHLYYRMFLNPAEYVEHGVVEFLDVSSPTKHTMTISATTLVGWIMMLERSSDTYIRGNICNSILAVILVQIIIWRYCKLY